MSGRVFHITVAGNPEDAIKHGLTLKAKCGIVWVPTIFGSRETHPEIPDCSECNSATPSRVPDRPHFVYRCYDDADRLIYVGCTVYPRQRFDQHKQSSWWIDQVARTRFTVFPNREYARYMESRAIAAENPRWNVQGRNWEAMSLADYRDVKFSLESKGASARRLMRLQAEVVAKFGESA